MLQLRILIAFIGLVCVTDPIAIADDQADFTALQKSLSKKLPKGWELESSKKTVTRDGRPAIVIRSKTKLLVEQIFPSSPLLPRTDPPSNPYLKTMIVEVRLNRLPYVSPKKFPQWKTENKERRRRRMEFGRQHFKGMRWYDTKGGRLYAPETLRPITAEQKRRVAEYATLWKKTVPHRMPTHHSKTQSFELIEEPYLMFQNKRDDRNYDAILKAINTQLTPYIKPKPKADEIAPPA